MTRISSLLLLLLSLALSPFIRFVSATNRNPKDGTSVCTSATNTFTVKVDLYASERGYYVFEECGEDWINPTLGLEFGETYTFIQQDRTNYYHPLDFSYFPDAHHVGANLLDPKTSGATAVGGDEEDCSSNMTCPSPMYYLNDGYLGTYSNIPELKPVTTNDDAIGLKVYEDLFFREMSTWAGFGTFSIKLKFDNEKYLVEEGAKDIFYYCRIHQFMAGRIKLLQNGVLLQEKDDPPMYYQQETPGPFDQLCGTYGLDEFQLPHAQCPDRFVCDVNDRMRDFASCIDAMNCHMVIGMTTKVSSQTELALFIHQMIPHHQNAVNMAKALLKAGFLPCDDLTNTEDPYCIMQALLIAIVARQNHEIGVMNNVLASLNLPPTDDCQVPIHNNGDHEFRDYQDDDLYASAGSATMCQGVAAAAAAFVGAAAHHVF